LKQLCCLTHNQNSYNIYFSISQILGWRKAKSITTLIREVACNL
jgi:hypothetical protein